ncbi:MAG: hypothetical protein KF756_04675 [Acidobacteria bacterium]|nr:hypothetical protein [Acidobacteriota bacterium]
MEIGRLKTKLAVFSEWLLVSHRGRSFPLSSNEITLDEDGKAVFISFFDDTGRHRWRLNSIDLEGEEILLDVAGPFGRERQQLRLVPRTPAAQLAAEIEAARLTAAQDAAELAVRSFADAKISRVSLGEKGGRLAHILLSTSNRTEIAVIADVTNTVSHTDLLASSILWSEKLGRRKRPLHDLLIMCEKRRSTSLRRLHAMLSEHWKGRLSIASINRREETPKLRHHDAFRMSELWREKPKLFVLPPTQIHGRTSDAIRELSPEKIDALHVAKGDTLRFLGLPFARVRKLQGRESAWFGTGRSEKHPLTDASWEKMEKLVRSLEDIRSSETTNKRHSFYRSDTESWLESILRRDITKLDANLRLSPIYHQFRSGRSEKIDLLAIRNDGRLVVIELKAKPDRNMIFQALDYWRNVEIRRRSGALAEAKLFGDQKIADRPAIIYLAAPAWSFHREFEFFARAISPDIEVWRFELHEEWRREIKVVSRICYSPLGENL